MRNSSGRTLTITFVAVPSCLRTITHIHLNPIFVDGYSLPYSTSVVKVQEERLSVQFMYEIHVVSVTVENFSNKSNGRNGIIFQIQILLLRYDRFGG